MQAVILAGGLGTRLRPLTYEIPKPMVPINGKPYLEYQINYLKKFGITDVLILIGYLGEQIVEYFGDGSQYGVKITYSKEENPLGTGGAIKLAENQLEDEFLIIYGDSFLPIDYGDLFNFYNKHGKSSLLIAYDNSSGKTPVPNNLAIDTNFLVQKYEKNSLDPALKYVESGVSLLKKTLTTEIPSNQKCSLEEIIFPKLIGENRLIAYITKEPFYDIGTPDRLETITNYFAQNDNI